MSIRWEYECRWVNAWVLNIREWSCLCKLNLRLFAAIQRERHQTTIHVPLYICTDSAFNCRATHHYYGWSPGCSNSNQYFSQCLTHNSSYPGLSLSIFCRLFYDRNTIKLSKQVVPWQRVLWPHNQQCYNLLCDLCSHSWRNSSLRDWSCCNYCHRQGLFLCRDSYWPKLCSKTSSNCEVLVEHLNIIELNWVFDHEIRICGIIREPSAPDTQDQNGKSERAGRSITTVSRK